MPELAVWTREAVPSDQEAIRNVLLDAYAEYEFLYPQERWEQYKANISDSVTDTKVTARIVALLNGELVGSVFLYSTSEAAYGLPELNIQTPIMRLLAVKRNVRGHGVATALIRASAAKSIAFGADTLHLHTSDLMKSAVRLYERLGFERAVEKDIVKEDGVVKSYRVNLKQWTQLQA
ncbi:GNAT family N-acetyltransferase [Paenibacillus sp. GCM10027627]|uniref:GNAT family N-acetyltransferase n=1 Tax=unclassified Paenibacillus TaxID=185978 RepID=UPI00363998D8